MKKPHRFFEGWRLAGGVIVAAAGVCHAEDQPLAGEAFAKATIGRTFFYSRDGLSYGAEQYLPGRQVIWAFSGDDCMKGYWYPEDHDICFVYEDAPDPQCWTFRKEGAGLNAQFRGDTQNAPLIATRSSPEPMTCMGPDVGV
jgi:hypothetical protein